MQKERIELTNLEYISNSDINKTKKHMYKVALVLGATLIMGSNSGIAKAEYINNIGEITTCSIPEYNSYFLGEFNMPPKLTNMEVVDLRKMENLDKIYSMRKFELNWNGNGGLPFSEDSILTFEKIIVNIVKQPDIAPTGRESLILQYELEDKSFLAFEVFTKKVNKVCIPQNLYELALEEEATENIIEFINSSVESFYGK